MEEQGKDGHRPETVVTPQQRPKRRLTKVGRVVSDKMDKTVVVAVDYWRRHPLYKKTIRRTSKFYAHDEHNVCRIGDLVLIEETRPLSKMKRWIVRKILERATPEVQAELAEERTREGEVEA
ncbi:MAG: 30S ribosomal protein S17 [Thermomicrobium sp.]|nr:30S ribosomal protein S17 [Thermomicrobium sp.]